MRRRLPLLPLRLMSWPWHEHQTSGDRNGIAESESCFMTMWLLHIIIPLNFNSWKLMVPSHSNLGRWFLIVNHHATWVGFDLAVTWKYIIIVNYHHWCSVEATWCSSRPIALFRPHPTPFKTCVITTVAVWQKAWDMTFLSSVWFFFGCGSQEATTPCYTHVVLSATALHDAWASLQLVDRFPIFIVWFVWRDSGSCCIILILLGL